MSFCIILFDLVRGTPLQGRRRETHLAAGVLIVTRGNLCTTMTLRCLFTVRARFACLIPIRPHC